MTGRRIADASAIAVLATMAMTWLRFGGLGLLVSGGASGFELMAKVFPLLIVTPVAAAICLLILVYSETSSVAYESNRRSLAGVRLLCAIVGALPVIYIAYSVMSYDITKETNGLAFMFAGLIPTEPGEGIWLNLIALLVLGVEAYIDRIRPSTQRA